MTFMIKILSFDLSVVSDLTGLPVLSSYRSKKNHHLDAKSRPPRCSKASHVSSELVAENLVVERRGESA